MNQNDTYGQPKPLSGITVAYTATAGTSAAIPDCSCVRLVATTACFVEISADGTAATTSSMYLPPSQPEYLYIPPNGKVSAIRAVSDGSLYVTPFIS